MLLATTRLKNISVTVEFLDQFLKSESVSRLVGVTNGKHFPGRGDGTGSQQGILGAARNITHQLLVEMGLLNILGFGISEPGVKGRLLTF